MKRISVLFIAALMAAPAMACDLGEDDVATIKSVQAPPVELPTSMEPVCDYMGQLTNEDISQMKSVATQPAATTVAVAD